MSHMYKGKYLFPSGAYWNKKPRKQKQKENVEVVDEVKRLLHVFVGVMGDCPRCRNRLNEYFNGEKILSEAADILSAEKEELRNE